MSERRCEMTTAESERCSRRPTYVMQVRGREPQEVCTQHADVLIAFYDANILASPSHVRMTPVVPKEG
jgi:hypothetical protein